MRAHVARRPMFACLHVPAIVRELMFLSRCFPGVVATFTTYAAAGSSDNRLGADTAFAGLVSGTFTVPLCLSVTQTSKIIIFARHDFPNSYFSGVLHCTSISVDAIWGRNQWGTARQSCSEKDNFLSEHSKNPHGV